MSPKIDRAALQAYLTSQTINRKSENTIWSLVNSVHRSPVLRDWVTLESQPLQPLVLPLGQGSGRSPEAIVGLLLATPKAGSGNGEMQSPWGLVCWHWPSQRVITLIDFTKSFIIRDGQVKSGHVCNKQYADSVQRALDSGTKLPQPATELLKIYLPLLKGLPMPRPQNQADKKSGNGPDRPSQTKSDPSLNQPLLDAAESGLVPKVRELLDKGAEINTTSFWSWTPLMKASDKGRGDVVNLLLERNADIKKRNSLGKSALVLAVEGSHYEVVRQLLGRGADVNDRINNTETGLTVLHKASSLGHVGILKLLIDKGANLNMVDGEKKTALIHACLAGQLAAMSALIAAGANVNQKDKSGATALEHAIDQKNGTVMERLVEAGADPNGLDSKSQPFLIRACENLEITKLLLSKGANIAQKDQLGTTSLMKAVEFQNPDLVGYLLACGANANDVDNNEETALMKACELGNEAIVKALIEKEASLRTISKDGFTAFLLTDGRRHPKLHSMLVSIGANRFPMQVTQENLPGLVLKAAKRLIRKGSVYYDPDIPATKLTNAAAMCKITAGVKILFLIDCTVWGSAKDCVLFGTKALHAHYVGDHTTILYTSFSSCSFRVSPEAESKIEYAPRKTINLSGAGTNSSDVLRLIEHIAYLVKEMNR